jgi:sec-independent protein translocase protein TatB
MELFGVGALEALLVLVITLVVVGPQRFPEIAREGGRWVRKARRFTAEVTAELREAYVELEEEVRAEGEELRSVREIGEEVRSGLQESATDIRRIGRDAGDAASVATTTSDATPADEAGDADLTAAKSDGDPATTVPAPPAQPIRPTAGGRVDPNKPRMTPREMQAQVSESFRQAGGLTIQNNPGHKPPDS